MKEKIKLFYEKIWWITPIIILIFIIMLTKGCDTKVSNINCEKCSKIHEELDSLENKIIKCCPSIYLDTTTTKPQEIKNK